MPYIEQNLRDEVDPYLRKIGDVIDDIENTFGGTKDGVLNYVISTIVAEQYDLNRYADLAKAMAVFTCAQHELYRRIGSVKEDRAIEKNSDIDVYKGW